MIKTKHILIISIFVLVFLITNKYFHITRYHIPYFSVSNDMVRVDIENNTGRKIESVKLSPQNITVYNIKKEERKTITFNQKGEGSYQLVIKFENNDSLTSEKYIEEGYFITETILKNKILNYPLF